MTKVELRLVHREIGLLKVENQNQSLEIALLKRMVESQDQKIDQKIAQEVTKQKMKGTPMKASNQHQRSERVRRKRAFIAPNQAIPKNKNQILDDQIIWNKNPLLQHHQQFLGQPSSCSDLSQLGYSLNGFYLVKATDGVNNAKNMKLESIFCAFIQPEGVYNVSAIEKRIAHLKLDDDVAAATGIHFHVQRHNKTKFANDIKPVNAFIPFDTVLLNMGEAFHKNTFIVPKPGVYRFIFTLVMASIPSKKSTTVTLCLNSLINVVGKSSTNKAGNSLTIEATLKLQKGDKIYLASHLGGGFQISWASFSGSLLD